MIEKESVPQQSRGYHIVNRYLNYLDNHIKEMLEGNIQEFFTLKQISIELAISHQHLSDTVKKITGHHPCYFYDEKIIDQAKIMLRENHMSSSEVAKILTYDPSNFSKFFKKEPEKHLENIEKQRVTL